MANIGLVLSGGGARGIAHLGVLQALEETGLPPDIISGVSAGALIGALYAGGYKPKQLLELVKSYSKLNLANIIQSPLGLFSSSGLLHFLNETIRVDDFDHLQIPLYVTATDMLSNSSVSFSKGLLFQPIIGSAAIPGLFSLVEITGYKLADGGILNNLPVECILDKCDRIIGVNVNNFQNDTRTQLGRMQLLDKSFHLSIAAQVAINGQQCSLLLEPPVCQFSMFDMNNADSLFRAGYNSVMEYFDQLTAWAK